MFQDKDQRIGYERSFFRENSPCSEHIQVCTSWMDPPRSWLDRRNWMRCFARYKERSHHMAMDYRDLKVPRRLVPLRVNFNAFDLLVVMEKKLNIKY